MVPRRMGFRIKIFVHMQKQTSMIMRKQSRGELKMYCPNCGKQIPDGSKFCSECGYQIPPVQKTFNKQYQKMNTVPDDMMRCPTCNRLIPKTSEKCPNCGFSVKAYNDAFKDEVQKPVQPETKVDSKMSITAFVFSFFIPIVGLILSIIDLMHKDDGMRHSFAVAALIISIVFMIMSMIIFANTVASGNGIWSIFTK